MSDNSSLIFPNFLILGAARSGTTSLYQYLSLHPQVFMSALKEPYFFGIEGETLSYRDPESVLNKEGITNLEDYLALFRNASGYKVVGEGSTNYLYSEKAALNIKKYAPNARMAIILRQPADRAYSNYMMMRRDGRETEEDFLQAFALEEERIAAHWEFGWFYKSLGAYSGQVRRYKEMFDPARLRIYLFDDLLAAPDGLYAELCAFLEIDFLRVPPEKLRENRSGLPRNDWLTHFMRRKTFLKRSFQTLAPRHIRKKLWRSLLATRMEKSPPLDPAIRSEITAIYKEDILTLQDLIARDLSEWLN